MTFAPDYIIAPPPRPGVIIMIGMPSGVGAVHRGDVLNARPGTIATLDISVV